MAIIRLKNAHAQKAAQILGGVAILADKIGCTRQNIYQWTDKVPAERVISIERATEGRIGRSEMRPDLYPPARSYPRHTRPKAQGQGNIKCS